MTADLQQPPALACTDCGKGLRRDPRRKGQRCQRCNARAMSQSAEKREKCRAAMLRRFEDPNYAARHRDRCTAGQQAALAAKPELRALRVELGRRVGRLGMGQTQKGAGSPERVAAGRKRSETVLGWCPVEYRDAYRRLRRHCQMSAAEARAMIEQQIEKDRAEYLRTGRLPQSERLAA
jgi:DNA-directed RNA polymerase subunit RPC12/RpoP